MKTFLAVIVTLGLVSRVLSLKCYKCDDQGVNATLATCEASATVVECQDKHICSQRKFASSYDGQLSYTVNKGCVEEGFSNDAFCKLATPFPEKCLAKSCKEPYCNGKQPITESPTDPPKSSPIVGGSTNPSTAPTDGSKLTCDNSGSFLSSTKQTTLFCLLSVAANVLLHRL